MASASQAPKMCELCDENKIQWKCLKCNSYLCTKCCKIHQKLISSAEHKIIAIEDIGKAKIKDLEIEKDLSNIMCKEHPENTCQRFCKTCETVVCKKCIKKNHKAKHEVVDIKEGYFHSIGKITKTNYKLDIEVLNLATGMSTLEVLTSDENEKFQAEKQKILQRDQDLKDLIDKHTKKLLCDLDLRWNIFFSSIKDEVDHGKRETQNLEIKNTEYNKVLKSLDAKDIFLTAEYIKKSPNTKIRPINTSYTHLPSYVPREVTPSTISHGTLQETTNKHNENINRCFQVEKHYTTNFKATDELACKADGSLWIGDYQSKKLYNVKWNERSFKTTQSLEDIKIYDMAITSKDDLLLATLETTLKVIPHKKPKQLISKFDVSPHIIKCVHVSHDDKILVGVRKLGPVFPIIGPRQVIVMDMEGTHIKTYNNNLFSYPFKITTDHTGTIYVIDCTSENQNGRVVVIGPDDSMKGVFKGHADINTKDFPFKPCDITKVSCNSALVIDTNTRMLYLLNNDALCIKFIHCTDLGIELPYSIATSNKRTMFIGSRECVGEKSSAKIHALAYKEEV
ncbi:uncharacterized protein LOC127738758 [Mytilus californianus]|uniref:uncharacterized protein LOC127738758 n=1 Tax=Mytilus californianus TaxID=6549 RepID=UPI0022463E29|nr:uncharacterized protein LOC127738758 [Mytilus californianus]